MAKNDPPRMTSLETRYVNSGQIHLAGNILAREFVRYGQPLPNGRLLSTGEWIEIPSNEPVLLIDYYKNIEQAIILCANGKLCVVSFNDSTCWDVFPAGYFGEC